MINDVFSTADILIPEGVSMEKWSVVACDQFSSQREYWERVREYVGEEPSTLNMIIPEVYLDEIDGEKKTGEISEAMDEYTERGLLRAVKDSFVYVERTLTDGRIRRGIVGAVDLEEYDFSGGAAAVLASEGTVLERLPARIIVRRNARLELPHIIAFIDDKAATVIEPLSEKTGGLTPLYDFDLMDAAGRVKGWRVSGAGAEAVKAAVRELGAEGAPGAQDTPGAPGVNSQMLMIVGDGNHSLAAAKVYWDEIKQNLSETEREEHPARRALVEVNNVYDSAISFEAIHRVVFNVDPAQFVSTLKSALPGGDDYELRWISHDGSGLIGVAASCIGDMLTLVQEFLDRKTASSGCRVDYIHDADAALRLAKQERCIGLILPAMDKSEIFKTVASRGVFPKKSFSVGHAMDKRFYLECRSII